MPLLAEIKRRKVFQVAAVYAVVSWLLVQIVATVEAPLSLPAWFDTAVIVLLAVGFPIAIVLGWAYDITPHGVELTGPIDSEPAETMPAKTGLAVNLTVIVVAAALLAAAAVYVLTRGELSTTPSIAVLPLESRSPDSNNDYYAAGFHEEILNQLAKIGGITVIARSAVMPFAGSTLRPSAIAADLGVSAILDGSVSFFEGEVNITVELVDAVTETQLWSASYREPFEDVFEIETEIATAIAAELEAELTPREQASLARVQTESAEAHAFYYRALDLSGGGDGLIVEEDVSREFRALLGAAISEDPNFALAYAARARDYAYELGRDRPLTAVLSTAELERFAEDDARRALAIDDGLAQAHGALAIVHRLNRRWSDARREFELAREASPSDERIVFDYALFNLSLGDVEAGIELANQYVELNPTAQGYGFRGLVLTFAGDWAGAEQAARTALRIGPPLAGSYGVLADALAARGEIEAALVQIREAERIQAEFSATASLVELIHIYARMGSIDDARRVFNDQLMRRAEEVEIGPGLWAYAYLALDDRAQALAHLEEAVANPAIDNGFVALYKIAHNYIREPILEEPEFVDVRERLGFRE